MSVINRMLQDLDKRRGRPAGDLGAGDAVRSVVPTAAGRRRQNVLLAILGLVIVSLAVGWWVQRRGAGAGTGNRAAVDVDVGKVIAADMAAVALPKGVPAVPAVVAAAPVALPAADLAAVPAAPPTSVAAAALAAAPVGARSASSVGSSTARSDAQAVVPAGAPGLAAATAPGLAAATASKQPAGAASSSSAVPARGLASAPAPGDALLAAAATRVVVPGAASAPAGMSSGAAVPPSPLEKATSFPPPRAATAGGKAADGKSYTPEQQASNLLGEAVRLEQQGRAEDAKVPLQKLLAANPLHVRARQMLAQLQLDTGNVEQARTLLAEGQRLLPDQSGFTTTLARLQVENGDVAGAIRLLEADRSSARSDPQFNAFLAALLLRVQRYDEAVQRYLVALRSDPGNASWLVGVGVALEGIGKQADAAEAYRRAEGSANLTPEMADFLSERLARLR
jgi:MSHA biogenesis protein MshN